MNKPGFLFIVKRATVKNPLLNPQKIESIIKKKTKEQSLLLWILCKTRSKFLTLLFFSLSSTRVCIIRAMALLLHFLPRCSFLPFRLIKIITWDFLVVLFSKFSFGALVFVVKNGFSLFWFYPCSKLFFFKTFTP